MKVHVSRMSYGTAGIGKAEDGRTVFVEGAVAGDLCECTITKETKSYYTATATEILEPSNARRAKGYCPYIEICGGCPWGLIARESQLQFKTENVLSNLKRIGKFSDDELAELVKPIRYTEDEIGYRNKIELNCKMQGNKRVIGMHANNPSTLIKIDACPLFERTFPKAVKAISGALSYLNNSRNLELERIGIRGSRRTKDLEIALWTPTGAFPRAQVSRVLNDAHKNSSIVRVMSKGDKRARRVSSIEALSGAGSWSEKIGFETMRFSGPSFFQVNTKGAEILIDLVMDVLKPQEDELAMDLYCGAGTFTLPLARATDFVSAVESYGPSVRDLRRNLKLAGIEHVDVIGGGR